MFKFLQSLYIITIFISKVFPYVKHELSFWQKEAREAEPFLAAQALASIKTKSFHCLGGAVYSLYSGKLSKNTICFIVALQTISDYLDNLCDRSGIYDEKAFTQLHMAMTDALTPHKPLEDYYLYYPYKEDGGYLAALVSVCQREVAKLPRYPLIQKDVLGFARMYCELQTYKHLTPGLREERIKLWTNSYLPIYPQLSTWEFAAATGSTLGIFVLFAAALSKKLKQGIERHIAETYFPCVCALHILLDYYIDEAEDIQTNDLNFVSYYTIEEAPTRILYFVRESFIHTQKLPHSTFHYTVLCGLLAMYLSDPKANTPEKKPAVMYILKSAGTYSKLLYRLCKVLRMHDIL